MLSPEDEDDADADGLLRPDGWVLFVVSQSDVASVSIALMLLPEAPMKARQTAEHDEVKAATTGAMVLLQTAQARDVLLYAHMQQVSKAIGCSKQKQSKATTV